MFKILKYKLTNILVISVFATNLFVTSCSEEIDYGSDPYGTTDKLIAVEFPDVTPIPSQVIPGNLITYKIKGVKNFSDVRFYLNNEESEITEITDSTLTVRISENSSTGGAQLRVNGQIFSGPKTIIVGKLGVDQTFKSGTGTNGTIRTIRQLANGQIYLGGSFTNYNGAAATENISGIVRISPNGEFVPGMMFGKSALYGNVMSINNLPDNRILISGSFNEFDEDKNVRNITLLNNTGELNRESVSILNLTDNPEYNTMVVPVFNGGTDRGITKSFIYNDKITLVGNFENYTSNYYPRSTFNQILYDFVPFKNIVRLKLNGSLDSSFLFNASALPFPKGGDGVNGPINDAAMTKDGSVIIVGAFTRYGNITNTNRIVSIKNDGTVDQEFMSNIQNAANGEIMRIIPIENEDKYFVVGNFSSFGSISNSNGVVLIDKNGNIDQTFKPKIFSGGKPNYATKLQNGLILITGSFVRYDGVTREGLVVINSDGELVKGFNNTGKLDGTVYDSFKGINVIGQNTIILVGNIRSFNGVSQVGNILRLSIQD